MVILIGGESHTGKTIFEIDDKYDNEMQAAYDYINDRMLNIRTYREGDLSEIAQLFYDTVHTVNAKDYTKEQLCVWAAGTIDAVRWNQSLLKHNSLVAVKGGIIAGFADVNGDYLDRLYVHKDYQQKGIATALVNQLEGDAKRSGRVRLHTHASITARPFFERRGYRMIKEQHVERDAILLTNFVMEKNLTV